MKYRLIRGSEVQDFLRCRKRWEHRWVRHLKPKRQDGKLFFGNLFHKFVEVYYTCGAQQAAWNAMHTVFEETDKSRMAQTDIDELWDLAYNVTKNYVDMWGEKDRGMRVIATELTFAIPLANGIAYTGTIDLIWLDENGLLWFKDYKTTGIMGSFAKNAEMDRQISRYFWALQKLANGEGYILEKSVESKMAGDEEVGKEEISYWIPANNYFQKGLPQPHGFIYDIIERDYPAPIELLKKGGLSVNKAQKTTYKHYFEAMVANGLVTYDEATDMPIYEEKYADMLQHLANQENENGNRFFSRFPVYREQVELEAAIQEFYATAMDMTKLRGLIENDYYYDTGNGYVPMEYDPIYRNITKDCSWDCGSKGLCQATMNGSSGDELVGLFYDIEVPEHEFIEIGGQENGI